MEKKNSKRGFTLVELIVVLVILAILAALLIPALTGYIDKARKSQVVAETRALTQAVQTEMSTMLSKNAFFLAASCHGKNPIKVWFSSSTHRQYAAFFPAFIFFPALSVAVSLKVRVYNPRLLGCGTFRDLLSLYSTCSLYHAKTSFLLTENLLASSVKSD